MKKQKITVVEFVWYAIASVIAIFGIILMVFGIVGHHLPGSLNDNFVKNAEKNLPLPFILSGVILVAIGVVLGIIVLCYYAKKADRDIERTIRRQQRLAAQNSNTITGIKSAVEVVEEKQPEPQPEQK